jgi:hypothetical protein
LAVLPWDGSPFPHLTYPVIFKGSPVKIKCGFELEDLAL